MAKPKAVEVNEANKNALPVNGIVPQTQEEFDALVEKWKKENPSQITDEKLAHLEAQRERLPSGSSK